VINLNVKELIASLTPVEREELENTVLKTAKGVMYAIIEWELRDKDGNLIRKGEQRSTSFVANLLRIVRRRWIATGINSGTGTVGCAGFSGTEPVDVGGSPRATIVGWNVNPSQQVNRYVERVDAGIGDVTCGLRIGTGTSTPTPTQVVLDVAIVEGSGAGQMNHGATTVDVITIAGSDVTFKVIRVFSNNSGGTITVKECAIYVYLWYNETTGATFMIARDLISPALDVPSGLTLTLRYIPKTTV